MKPVTRGGTVETAKASPRSPGGWPPARPSSGHCTRVGGAITVTVVLIVLGRIT